MSQSQYWVGHFLASESRIREDARIVTMEDAMRIRTRKATEIWVRGAVALLLAGLIPLLQGCSSPHWGIELCRWDDKCGRHHGRGRKCERRLDRRDGRDFPGRRDHE